MTWWESPQWLAYEAAGGYPSRAQELAGATWSTRIVDLTTSEAELWRGLRKSYRSLIHRAERETALSVWAAEAITVAQELHDREAGRATRPAETWRLMGDWIREGHGLLVGAEIPNEPKSAFAYAYFLVNGTWAYYASAASLKPNVNHALVWLAMRTLKANGVHLCELGWQGQATDDKGRSIEFFRAGFGGETVPARPLPASDAVMVKGSGLEIEIDCSCGKQHRIPLDASGHYSGPLPCDSTKHAELQIDPSEWREMVGAARQKQAH